MAGSLRNIVLIGLGLAVADLFQGIATCIFYFYELAVHYRCHSYPGLRWCQYYLYHTDHSLRVKIGIAEGIIGVLFSAALIVGLCKHKALMTWMWLPPLQKYKPLVLWLWFIKALEVIIVNVFFLSRMRWLAQKSRYHHSIFNRHHYDHFDQDNAFIAGGITLTVIEFIIMMLFCCINGSFTYKILMEREPNMDVDETSDHI